MRSHFEEEREKKNNEKVQNFSDRYVENEGETMTQLSEREKEWQKRSYRNR